MPYCFFIRILLLQSSTVLISPSRTYIDFYYFRSMSIDMGVVLMLGYLYPGVEAIQTIALFQSCSGDQES